MNITIVAIGKAHTEYFEAAIAEYQKRLGRWTQVTWKVLASNNLKNESQQLLKIVKNTGPHAVSVLLDERGQQWSALQLASQLETWQNQAIKNATFIIGGAHGVSEAVRQQVTHTWSLSNLVFPHELVRVLLIEQLYRAYDLNAGGKYHHQ